MEGTDCSSSSSHGSSGEVASIGNTSTATFHGWKYKHYFVLLSEDEKNLKVRCTLCSGNKTLSCARNTTSNFKKHLSAVHKNAVLVAKEVEQPEKRKRRRNNDDHDNDSDPKRQCTLPAVLNRNSISATKMRSLLSEYIIEDMQPLTTVESPAFRKLMNSICTTQLPDRKSFTQHLDKVYDLMVSKVKQTLEAVNTVSTTVDVWTAHHRSYLGMTAHWIDSHSLKRCKAAIACVRIRGRHTYDVLACKIEQIHASYSLTGKVRATITDNGSNFVKAFSVYSLLDSSDTAVTIAEDAEDETEDVAFEDVSELLTLDLEETNTDDDLTQVQYELPPHYRCAAHTLNLIASKDVDKYLSSSSTSKSVYRSSFAKSSALWNKASRSSLASDIVEEVAKRKLIVPTVTRWNSHYDAVVRISENSMPELNELCTKMELRCFSERELNFLKEYCLVLKPLARSLDILQGEDNCFYGTLLPTLETVIKKLVAVKPNLSSMTIGLPGVIEEAIRHRFRIVFHNDSAIMAAITLPMFRLKWVDSQSSKDLYKQMLIKEMRSYQLHAVDNEVTVVEESQEQASQTTGHKKDDFYDFKSDEESTSQGSVEIEANDYLTNAKKIASLHNYPTVKRLFMIYNTPLPSSAPVERLFSLGGLVLSPKRNRLADSRFEKLLLMRYNKEYLDI